MYVYLHILEYIVYVHTRSQTHAHTRTHIESEMYIHMASRATQRLAAQPAPGVPAAAV